MRETESGPARGVAGVAEVRACSRNAEHGLVARRHAGRVRCGGRERERVVAATVLAVARLTRHRAGPQAQHPAHGGSARAVSGQATRARDSESAPSGQAAALRAEQGAVRRPTAERDPTATTGAAARIEISDVRDAASHVFYVNPRGHNRSCDLSGSDTRVVRFHSAAPGPSADACQHAAHRACYATTTTLETRAAYRHTRAPHAARATIETRAQHTPSRHLSLSALNNSRTPPHDDRAHARILSCTRVHGHRPCISPRWAPPPTPVTQSLWTLFGHAPTRHTCARIAAPAASPLPVSGRARRCWPPKGESARALNGSGCSTSGRETICNEIGAGTSVGGMCGVLSGVIVFVVRWPGDDAARHDLFEIASESVAVARAAARRTPRNRRDREDANSFYKCKRVRACSLVTH